MKIRDIGFGSKPEYIIEIPNKEIDHLIDRFGEAFGKVIVKGLEEERKKAKK